jgi:parallel beta-helix repeat protein
MGLRRRGAVVGAALSAALVLGVVLTATAGAADGVIECGSVITEDTVLTHDLLDCENGLIIGASDVTLDLGDHQIVGRGEGVGVLLQEGTSPAVVKNGAIRSFGAGVRWLSGSPTLSRLELASNGVGIYADFFEPAPQLAFETPQLAFENGAGSFPRIENNTIHDNGTGISLIFAGAGYQILNNRILNNNGGGMVLFQAGANLVDGNLVRNNDRFGAIISVSPAIVTNNSFTRNGGDGLLIDERCGYLNDSRVGSNVFDRNQGLGFNANQNSAGACPLPPPTLLDAGGNAASRNGDPRQCIYIECARNRGQADKFAP